VRSEEKIEVSNDENENDKHEIDPLRVEPQVVPFDVDKLLEGIVEKPSSPKKEIEEVKEPESEIVPSALNQEVIKI